MNTLKGKTIKLLATGFGSGLVPLAPGTAGTLVSIPLYFFLAAFSWPGYLFGLIAFTAAAVYVAGRAEALYAVKDPPCIVIDEMAGFLWAMFTVPPTLPGVLWGFIFFRIFDIAKPLPIRTLQDKLPGGFGVVADDIMAGVYSNVALRLLITFAVL